MGVGLKLPPLINLKCCYIGRPCPDVSEKVWHLSVGIWDGIVNPIYGCRVRMAPFINPRDIENVSYVDVRLV